MSRILYTKPSITALEIEFVTDAITHGWGDDCYGYIQRFEKEFAQYVGTSKAIATASCTGALHLGLAALGIGPGDEVILADTNWVASLAPILYLGATPIFVDVLPDTWCLDPAQVEQAITAKTKAIIAVHLYGNLCDMDRLLALSQSTGIPLIEDAAEAVGSVWHGHHAGSMGRFGVFSFHGTKTLSTGEGGIFVTHDDALYDRVLTLSNHGRAANQPKQFWPDLLGYKYKMSNLQAALGCAQLQRVDELVARKREILHYYRQAFAHIPAISMNPEPVGTQNGAWMPTLVVSQEAGITTDQMRAAFQAQAVDARVFFHPLSTLPFIQQTPQPTSLSLAERGLNLPSYHDMTTADLNKIVQIVYGLFS
ncbi:DegT/DnrJ/EryC1/StrS family aminotransferase [Parvibium lacunae]|uniref:DegT/DnrJ/EryC1/StrS family aminotransferase n=1 Tax=Parvibium lacunae TaxID=1888893 RepID=A0A368L3Q9_9BURK|nr:DegT/DnrJ/EryC1/StrS family aminotransferase [Parvibium lacunae]RCS58217.1 DegT/DnrJ/EryC1/StrS family aminotransferase [Parvibium lacunae]